MSEQAIARLERLFAERTGIDLGRGLKGKHLHRFVAARATQLGLPSMEAYVDRLEGAELAHLIDTATVGLSWFFRDADQLGTVAQIFRDAPAGPLDVWVAGCATGEDVYSLAMLAEAAGREASILGTDINSQFVAQAGRGDYCAWSVRSVPPEHASRLVEGPGRRFQVAPSITRRVRFLRHNLMDPPPVSARGWDLILCRNVLIYFHAESAARTVDRLARALTQGGWLMLGANEMLRSQSPWVTLEPIGGRYALRRHERRDSPAAAPAIVPAPPPAPRAPEPPSVRDLLARANNQHAAGQLAQALTLYAQVLALDPLSAEARMFLGIAHFKTGDPTSAAVALRAALFLEPELWPAAFYLALSYERLGNPVNAALEYRRVVQSSGHALPGNGGPIVRELEAWKHEVVQLARERAAPAPGVGRR